jgi:hypothetical protein
MYQDDYASRGNLLVSLSTGLVDRKLAGAIGLEAAFILQDVFYWSQPQFAGTRQEDGRNWVRASIRKWTEEKYPWTSRGTIQRRLSELVNAGLLYERHDLNEHDYDRTAWYSVNFEQMERLELMVRKDSKTARIDVLPVVPSWKDLMEEGDTRCVTPAPGESPSPEVSGSQDVILTHGESPPMTQGVSRSQRDPSQSETTIQKKEGGNGLSSIQEEWPSFLDLVASQTSKDVFHTSFQGSRPADVNGNVLVVETPGQREADWINNRVGEIALSAFLAANPGTDIEKLWARPWRSK